MAVLADSDTRWKWGALTARRLAPEARIDGLLLRGRATPTPRQLAEVGVTVDSLREVSGVRFVGEALARGGDGSGGHAGAAPEDGPYTGPDAGPGAGADADSPEGGPRSPSGYDMVVLSCVGGAVQAMLHGMARASGAGGWVRRPVVVTGYVGVVYEKLADGLLLRHGADLVLANSAYDADRFRAVYEGVGAGSGSVTEVALPFLGGAPYQPPGGARPFTVTFAAQPSVPASRADRTYLLRRAVGHAQAHPEREVLIKLRSKPGEHTTHIEEQPYQRLAARHPGGLPPNCRLVYGHMGEVLDRTDLLVTVSSTAALEALHRSVPTAVLTDLGVREVLGNHHFLGSGCLASWDELDAGLLPKAAPEWTVRQGVLPDGQYTHAFDTARERVARLAARDRLPALAPYYTPATAPGYLPGILARYGFAPDGTPLPGAAGLDEETGSPVARAVRGAVRDVARGAYRHGVQRVAPVIRRMGEL